MIEQQHDMVIGHEEILLMVVYLSVSQCTYSNLGWLCIYMLLEEIVGLG